MCPDVYSPIYGVTPYGTCNDLRSYYASIIPNQPNMNCVAYDPMSMQYSVYGADIDLLANGGLGSYPIYSGAYGGADTTGAYTGGYAGYNPETMYQQMDRWTDYMFDRNVKYTEKSRAQDMRLNGPMTAVQYAADALKEKVAKDAQPQIQEAFEKYKETLRSVYPEYANLDDKALTAKAMELYKERNQIALKDDIRNNSKDIFMQKFLNGATFGTLFKGSAEETISNITGNQMAYEDKVKGSIGTVAGAAVSLTAGFQALKHSGTIAKVACKNPIATLILAAATALGVYSFSKS